MTVRSDIVVVGAGVIGLTTAYELQRRGLKVALVEARKGVALETSHANGSILTPSISMPFNGPGVHRHLAASLLRGNASPGVRWSALPSLIGWGARFLRNSTAARFLAATKANYTLGRHSLGLLRGLRDELDLDYDASNRGTLKLFRSTAALESALELARVLEPLGLRCLTLDRAGTTAVEPELDSIVGQIAGAVHFPDDESGDAHKFCVALARRFEADGGRLIADSPVVNVETDRGRVSGVRINGTALASDRIVMSAGNATAGLVAPLGIRLAIRPVKGYTVTFDATHLERRPGLPVLDDDLHAGVVPLGGRVRLAGTAEFCGHDLSLDPARIRHLTGLLDDIYPRMAAQLDLDNGRPWTGLRPVSADGVPLIGESALRGLYLNAGHGHLGWTLAMGSAQLLADVMTGSRPMIDPVPYRANRH